MALVIFAGYDVLIEIATDGHMISHANRSCMAAQRCRLWSVVIPCRLAALPLEDMQSRQ
jgi:hypothetical protein